MFCFRTDLMVFIEVKFVVGVVVVEFAPGIVFF